MRDLSEILAHVNSYPADAPGGKVGEWLAENYRNIHYLVDLARKMERCLVGEGYASAKQVMELEAVIHLIHEFDRRRGYPTGIEWSDLISQTRHLVDRQRREKPVRPSPLVHGEVARKLLEENAQLARVREIANTLCNALDDLIAGRILADEAGIHLSIARTMLEQK